MHPQPGYPYGFTEPVTSVQTLLLIARGVSVLMGVGTVVVAYLAAKTLWDRAVGLLAMRPHRCQELTRTQ